MGIKKYLLGTAGTLLIGAVCAFGAYPAVEAYAAEDIPINGTTFPDSAFRAYVSANFDKDGNGELSSSEINSVKSISVGGKEIKSLEGIEYFTYLTSLYCYNGNISKLDVSNLTSLTYLNCSSNNISELDVSKLTALEAMYCDNNNISELDVSNLTSLTYLNCSSNNISELDVSNLTSLAYLNCSSNNISELDVINLTALISLFCANNNISILEISNLTSLTSLNCQYNNISTLDVNKCINLEDFFCDENKITLLDISNCSKLKHFSCANNFILHKSDIIGLNEEVLEYCYYIQQYYDGYEEYITDAEPYFFKVITRKGTTIHPMKFGYNATGIPDPSVYAESEGIIFISKFNRPLYTTNDPDVKISFNTILTAFTDGEHTVTLTIKNGVADGVDFQKDFVITAVSEEQHQKDGHEFTRYNITLDKNYHFQQCFCGEQTESEPHEIGEIVEYIDFLTGETRTYGLCTKCSYTIAFEEDGDVLEDEETNIQISGFNDTDLTGKSLDVEVKTEDISPDIAIKIGDDVVIAYDIRLIDEKSGTEVQPDGYIRITIPVPEGVDGEKAKIYHISDDGTVTDMNAQYNSETKTLSFITDHLSIYAVAVQKSGSAHSGDINNDGEFDMDDVIDLARSVLFTTPGSQNPYLSAADLDNSGEIDMDDVILLARKLIMG